MSLPRCALALVLGALSLAAIPPRHRKTPDLRKEQVQRAYAHYEQGRRLFREGKVDEAVAEYRAALDSQPDEAYWHAALGKALVKKDDAQSALEEYRLAVQLSPLDSGLVRTYQRLAGKQPAEPRGKPAPKEPGLPRARVSQVDANVIQPVPTYKPLPPYSEKARLAKYQGVEVLWIVVDEHGDVSDTRVVEPLGLGLDQKAIETVRTWKFKPATRKGVPVAVRLSVEVSFGMRIRSRHD